MSSTKCSRAAGDTGAGRDSWRHTVADAVRDSYGDRITRQTVRGYASAHTPTSNDRHGARATQQTVGGDGACRQHGCVIEANRICRSLRWHLGQASLVIAAANPAMW